MSDRTVVLKRIYDDPAEHDGHRVLVDRIWPRGVSKARAQLNAWPKDIAPSPELRTWWDHDPARFEEFAERYTHELADDAHAQALEELLELVATHDRVTLLFGAKDETVNHAVVLRDVLVQHR